jgi:hypothetical protein
MLFLSSLLGGTIDLGDISGNFLPTESEHIFLLSGK